MFLYKYVFNGETVYIGKTSREVKLRIDEHRWAKDLPDNCDIYIAECESEADMNVMEILLIDKYRPVYNKDCNSVSSIKSHILFEEPEWIKFEEYQDSIKTVEYGRNVKGDIVGVTDTGKEIKPVYCSCCSLVQTPEYILTDNYLYQICRICGLLIKNTFKDKLQ